MNQTGAMYVRMNDLCEGPYEKGLRRGVLCLSDEELLAILIRSGYRERNALCIASEVLSLGRSGVRNISERSVNDLKRIKGLGTVKALTLKAAAELGRRIQAAEKRESVRMNSPESVAGYFMERMSGETVETVCVAFFDRGFQLIGETELSRGTEDRSFLSIRNVFLEACRFGASHLIVLHNHPSGNPEPSMEDRRITDRLREAGNLMEIPLEDHIIIGQRIYYSFKEHGDL